MRVSGPQLQTLLNQFMRWNGRVCIVLARAAIAPGLRAALPQSGYGRLADHMLRIVLRDRPGPNEYRQSD